MNIQDYKIWSNAIKRELPLRDSYTKYIRLCQIFVQDCAIDIPQKHYGNLTKQKSKVLFELQEKFLNSYQL